MGAGGRTLADAFVRVRPEGKTLGPELTNQTEKAGDAAGKNAGHHFGEAMKRAIKGAGLALAVGAAFVGIKAIGFLKDANAAASDLNETVSKAQNVFPKTTAALNQFAATSAAALGLSRQQALDGAASFGQFFTQIGIGEKQSLKMSTALIQLSADFGSFANAEPGEVMDAFLSATRGEYDALQRFLPTINAATVQAEALRLTHKKSTKDLTEADKALALYQLSLKGVGKAQNDFAETAGGQANATRTWKANLADIRAEIGTALLPVVATFINALNSQLVPLIRSLWAEHGPQVVKFFGHVVDGMEAFIAAINTGEAEGEGFAGFMSRLAVSLQNIGPTLRGLVADVKAYFASQGGGQGGDLSANLKSAADSAKQLLPLVKEFIADLPSLSDVVNVAGTVLGFLADHTDELREAMPILVAAVVAYKVAQLAANIAVAASPIFKIADAIATRQQTAALRAQTAAMVANRAVTATTTAAVAANTAVENVGLLTRVRSVVVMVAQRVAMVAVRAATLAWTAGQWLLNAALLANPIGLIIIAIVALVAGIIYAYKHSETFRKIVQAAWHGIQVAAKAVVDWFVNTAWPFLQKVWDGIVLGVKIAIALVKAYFELARSIVLTVFRWIAGFIQDRIDVVVATVRRVREIATAFRDAFERGRAAVVEKTNAAIAFVKSIPGKIKSALGNLGSLLVNAGRDLIQGLLNGINGMLDRLKGLLGKVTNLLPDWKGPLSRDLKILAPSGEAIMTGFMAGIDRKVPELQAKLQGITAGLAPSASGGRASAAGDSGYAEAGPTRLHPADLRLLAEMLGEVMYRAIGLSGAGDARQSQLYVRGA